VKAGRGKRRSTAFDHRRAAPAKGAGFLLSFAAPGKGPR
jgi:hypothetical protein